MGELCRIGETKYVNHRLTDYISPKIDIFRSFHMYNNISTIHKLFGTSRRSIHE